MILNLDSIEKLIYISTSKQTFMAIIKTKKTTTNFLKDKQKILP